MHHESLKKEVVRATADSAAATREREDIGGFRNFAETGVLVVGWQIRHADFEDPSLVVHRPVAQSQPAGCHSAS